MTAAVRCAPPGNRPLREELANCFPYLAREFRLLRNVTVIVPLGRIAFDAVMRLLDHFGVALPRPQPVFEHGALIHLPGQVDGRPVPEILCTYHPSRQNTNTGRLTEKMLDRVFARARCLVGTAP
jgi:uracil-DNA glycosylase family 4